MLPGMRALSIDDGVLRMTSASAPEVTKGESLVAVRVVGVCDTDLELARGYMGFSGIPGHEFVGEVIESDSEELIGRRVVGDINAGCGTCEDCTVRDGHHCAARTVLGIAGRGGAFAELLALPTSCLVEVPDHVADDLAVFAEPVAAALHVLDDAAHLAPEEPILVLGDGKLGLLIALALRSAGRNITLVGRHPGKLALAACHGVETCLEASFTPVAKFPLVVEATGSPTGLASALLHIKPRGTIIQKTTVAGEVSIDLARLVVDEIRLVGSRCGNMKRAVESLAAGSLDPRSLIVARYPLEHAIDAFARASTKGVLKVLVDVGTATPSARRNAVPESLAG